MRTKQIGLCRHNLRTYFLRFNIGTSPETSLTNGHIKEIFPSLRLKVFPEFLQIFIAHTGLFTLIEEGIQSNISSHVDWSTTGLVLVNHQMVTQTGRSNGRSTIRHKFCQLIFYRVAVCIELTKTVLYFSFEKKEPGTNRSVAIFKTGWGETIFHHGHGSTNLSTHGVGGTSIPYRVPCTTFTLTGRPGTEDVNSTTTSYKSSLATENMNFIFTGRETNSTSNLVSFVFVKQHLNNKDTLKTVLFTKCGFCWLSNDTLVRLTVNHDLPFTGTYRGSTFTQGWSRFCTIKVLAVRIFLPNGKSPFFEQFNRLINVTTTVIDQILTYNAHQIVTNHFHVILNWILTNISINSGKPLGNSTRTLHGSLVNESNFQVIRGPLLDFKSGTTSCHSATNDQNVNIMLYDLWINNGVELTPWFIW